MFFPRLKTDQRKSVRLTAEELGPLYDIAIRPAAVAIMPDIVLDWPGSFSTAEWKDRNSKSGFSHTSHIIPQNRLQRFSEQIRRNIEANGRLQWARTFFWGVEIRGVKDMCSHSIDASSAEMERHLEMVLDQIDSSEGQWWGDIGLEFMLTDQALLWSTDGHRTLLCHLLGITREDAGKIISHPLCYTRDLTTHIMSLSGFRADFNRYEEGHGVGNFFASYVQAYQTDKHQTYHPEGSRYGKTITGKLAVKGNPPPWCQSLLQVYGDAAKEVNVATRFEARVPLPFINNALINPRLDVLKQTMICYKRELWW